MSRCVIYGRGKTLVLNNVLPRGGQHFSPENLLQTPHLLVYDCVSLLPSFQITPNATEVTLAIVVF